MEDGDDLNNGIGMETKLNTSDSGTGAAAVDDDCDKGSEFMYNMETAGSASVSVKQRLLTDAHLRHKCFHTVCVALAFLSSGWRMSMVGPSLPDIRLIIHADLVAVSWILSALALGGLVGCLGGGILYDKVNKCLMFVSLTFVLAAATVATPWCSNYPAMVAIHVLNGICTYGIDTVTVADIGLVWRLQSAPAMQAVNFAYSVGAMIAPLSTEPFFAERVWTSQVEPENTLHQLNSSNPNTYIDLSLNTEDSGSALNATDATTDAYRWTYGQTRIHYAYIVAGSVSFMACLLMLLQFCILGSVHVKIRRDYKASGSDSKAQSSIHYPLSRKWKFAFVVLLALLLGVYCTLERLFYSYFMEFMLARFPYDKATGAKMTTTFWATFTVGRLLSIFVVRVLKPIFVFAIFIGILISGEVSMLFAANHSIQVLVWLACALYGLGLSALCGSIISYVSTKVCAMTGKISSVMLFTVIVGAMVYPVIIGNIMSAYSYDWFVYLAMILTGIMSVMVVFMEVMHRCLT